MWWVERTARKLSGSWENAGEQWEIKLEWKGEAHLQKPRVRQMGLNLAIL